MQWAGVASTTNPLGWLSWMSPPAQSWGWYLTNRVSPSLHAITRMVRLLQLGLQWTTSAVSEQTLVAGDKLTTPAGRHGHSLAHKRCSPYQPARWRWPGEWRPRAPAAIHQNTHTYNILKEILGVTAVQCSAREASAESQTMMMASPYVRSRFPRTAFVRLVAPAWGPHGAMLTFQRRMYRVQLAEAARRPHDAWTELKQLAATGEPLSWEERGLFGATTHAVLAGARQAYRVVSRIAEQEDLTGAKKEAAVQYRTVLGTELAKVVGDVQAVLAVTMIPKEPSPEGQVFYYTILGDCGRAKAEIIAWDDSDRADIIQQVLCTARPEHVRERDFMQRTVCLCVGPPSGVVRTIAHPRQQSP